MADSRPLKLVVLPSRTAASGLFYLVLLMLNTAGVEAQLPPPDDPRVGQLLQHAAQREPQTLETQIALCEIAAPTFAEEERASEFQVHLHRLGLQHVRIDDAGNVIAEIPGSGKGSTVLLAAHLDTVFPRETELRVTRSKTLLEGPGISDDCRGLAVVLAVAETIQSQQVRLAGRLVIAATVGEEGLGNLRGVRHLFTHELKDQIDYFISVDGGGRNLTHRAVGSQRFKAVFSGPGGHSYHAFGLPNPIHGAARAIDRITRMPLPEGVKSTFNVGLIEGGTSINSIPRHASFSIDLRSESAEALQQMVAYFRESCRQAVAAENQRWKGPQGLDVTIETLGIRPAGSLPADSPLVRTAVAAAQRLGFKPLLTSGSTDANFPLSLGIPAIAINGGGQAEGAHSLMERFDTQDSHLGTQWALLLTLALVGLAEEQP